MFGWATPATRCLSRHGTTREPRPGYYRPIGQRHDLAIAVEEEVNQVTTEYFSASLSSATGYDTLASPARLTAGAAHRGTGKRYRRVDGCGKRCAPGAMHWLPEGRGGPAGLGRAVVAAAVVLPAGLHIAGVADSKILRRRGGKSAAAIARSAQRGCGDVSARAVERSISCARPLAMRIALGELDQWRTPRWWTDCRCGAPGHSRAGWTAMPLHCVAAASIIAKYARHLMCDLVRITRATAWPFTRVRTTEHRAAISALGQPCAPDDLRALRRRLRLP
jgi:hypothetical protein